MKLILPVIFLYIFSFNLYSQNFFPHHSGDKITLLKRESYVDPSFSSVDTSFSKITVTDTIIDGNSYVNFPGKWYSYDQAAQKLYIYSDGERKLSVDFLSPKDSSFSGCFSGLCKNFVSEGIVDGYFGMDYNEYPTFDIRAQNKYKFKDGFGYWSYRYFFLNTSANVSSTEDILPIECVTATDTFTFEKPQLSISGISDTLALTDFPLKAFYLISHKYPVFIDSICAFVNVYRADTLALSQTILRQTTSPYYFPISFSAGEIQLGDVVKLNFLLSDTSLVQNKIRYPEYGTYDIKVVEATPVNETPFSPEVFSLEQNYPNPFNPSTLIKFTLPASGNSKLIVYNVLGKEVAVLINGYEEEGIHEVKFNGENLSSGIYFYRLESGTNIQMKKMLLMK